MQYSYIARQPILNQQKSLIGYELLFRDGPNNKFPDIEPNQATSRLVSDHFWSVHQRIASSLLSFVNFPYQSLINLVPTLLPKERIVIEILEDCPPTEELLAAVKHLVELGYKIALDDFVPNNAWKPFLPFVSYIKFDIQIVPIEKARQFISRLQGSPIQFIAEKVETHAEFEQALQANFSLFQGYFFSKPEIVTQKQLCPTRLTMLQLCEEISKEPVDYNAVEALISRDVSLSYKLLTLVNSSAHIFARIQSFKQAIIYLGEQKLRKFISLLAIASTNEEKPLYLFRLSLQTARFCEQIAPKAKLDLEPGSAFLTGIFCYLDSILDQPIDELLTSIPIDQNVKEALISGTGELGRLLTLSKAYERANWEQVNLITAELELRGSDTVFCYNEAIQWASELFEAYS
ncbi:EAL and HDOD domain-containing protein [Vibrio mangrovi]|uniref:EAL domain protein n=1 Tax=Vibrio mangrovi TaxID=474394 RepID=A0A1Y6IPB5_9VIBR|nr:HDOD domain-containing protein [Vibrio mangrovi]MDW6003712.1 HDOD domain-containing protein [Vibrio mangrovi]SMR99496.1 EAL domain protein [Vibrio mangrovi]